MGPLVGTPPPDGSGAYRSVLHLGGLTMLAPPPHLTYPTVGCYGGQSADWGSSLWLIRGVLPSPLRAGSREAIGHLSGRWLARAVQMSAPSLMAPCLDDGSRARPTKLAWGPCPHCSLED